MRDGALLAIEAVNAGACGDVRLAPQIVDPGGVLDAYRVACDDLLGGAGIRHLVGCYTSSSRKEIIPTIEKFDALLWYPSHYEGFESCDNVIYGGAAPNQHVVPLVGWALPRYGHDVYCVGSNYVWSWETTRIMRELVEGAGGRVLRERYLPIGATDVDAILREVRDTVPDVVFNTLIGESSYAFYRAYHRLSRQEERFRAERRPILSCTLSEPEVQAIGPRRRLRPHRVQRLFPVHRAARERRLRPRLPVALRRAPRDLGRCRGGLRHHLAAGHQPAGGRHRPCAGGQARGL